MGEARRDACSPSDRKHLPVGSHPKSCPHKVSIPGRKSQPTSTATSRLSSDGRSAKGCLFTVRSETSPGRQPSEILPSQRLDSWKEIAAHFDRDVTTVQRWEKREGMPVHRHLHDRAGSIYAFTAELDAWARGRNLRVAQETTDDAPSLAPFALPPPAAVPTSRSRWRVIVPLAAAAALLVIGVIVWLQRTEYFWRDP